VNPRDFETYANQPPAAEQVIADDDTRAASALARIRTRASRGDEMEADHARDAGAIPTYRPPQPGPRIAAPKDDTTDATQASRMSRAQLADRIRQMEATAEKYRTQTFPAEKPSARIQRQQKLTAYKAELARREAADAAERQAEADTVAAGGRVVSAIEEAAAKLAARLAIECPQCHAAPGARCTNYAGAHCAPHSARKSPAAKNKPTSQAEPELSELDRAVEALVRQHTSGAVIDAAWAAAHRIFRPAIGGRP
jgi:hypothetical protein